MEDREDREFKELRERLSLNSLNSLNSLKSLIYHLNQQEQFLVKRVADATLGKNPDDGLYFGVLLIVGTLFASGGRCALIAGNFLLEVVRCGTSKKGPPRDSTNSTARGGQLLAMCRRLRLITRNNLLSEGVRFGLSQK